jgi:hypothetical protein
MAKTPNQKNHDSARKRAERKQTAVCGLKKMSVYLYAPETSAFRSKAAREGWKMAFSESARRKLGLSGTRVDLTPLFHSGKIPSFPITPPLPACAEVTLVIAPRPNRKSKKNGDLKPIQDLPGQGLFWDDLKTAE